MALTLAQVILQIIAMEVQFTADQKAFVRQASLCEERERTRLKILSAVDEAEASMVRGEGRIITQESMRQLAADVKHRGLIRLTAEQQTPR